MIINDLAIRVGEGNVVKARELHEALEIRVDFATWSSKVIEKSKINRESWKIIKKEHETEIHKLIEGCDDLFADKYVAIKFKTKIKQFKGTRFENKLFDDYIISLEMAKHIAMMSNSKMGEEIRSYYLNIEEREYNCFGEKNAKRIDLIF